MELSKQPGILEKSEKKGYRKGPINKQTIIIYRIVRDKKQIQIINIRGAKQKPLK